jgi:hypothetical protein
MDKFELKPKFFNTSTNLMALFCLAGTVPLFFVITKAYSNYIEFPIEPIFLQVLLFTLFTIIIVWSIFIIFVKIVLNRKIVVENDLIYFKQKTNLGFGSWTIKNVINPKEVDIIIDKQKTRIIPTGNGMIPLVMYWIIFQNTKGIKQEILINGWSVSDIRSLFYYIKGKYPHIKFNNNILRDTPEKIAGIN